MFLRLYVRRTISILALAYPLVDLTLLFFVIIDLQVKKCQRAHYTTVGCYDRCTLLTLHIEGKREWKILKSTTLQGESSHWNESEP